MGSNNSKAKNALRQRIDTLSEFRRQDAVSNGAAQLEQLREQCNRLLDQQERSAENTRELLLQQLQLQHGEHQKAQELVQEMIRANKAQFAAIIALHEQIDASRALEARNALHAAFVELSECHHKAVEQLTLAIDRKQMEYYRNVKTSTKELKQRICELRRAYAEYAKAAGRAFDAEKDANFKVLEEYAHAAVAVSAGASAEKAFVREEELARLRACFETFAGQVVTLPEALRDEEEEKRASIVLAMVDE